MLSSVDAILAEILGGSAALHELMGPAENLGQALNNLVTLFLGKPPEGGNGGEGLAALTHHFAADDLPEARTAIANRIVAEFKSNKRLCPDFMVEELKTLRSMANRIVMGVGKYLSHEDLIAAFTLRSKRLVAQEAHGPAYRRSRARRKDRAHPVRRGQYHRRGKQAPAFHLYHADAEFGRVREFLPESQAAAGAAAAAPGAAADAGAPLRLHRRDPRGNLPTSMDMLAVQMEARGKLFESIEARSTSRWTRPRPC